MELKYTIINDTEISSMDFSKLKSTSASTIRHNVTGDKAIVKFEGSTPSFLSGKTIYTLEEILVILDNKAGEWYSSEDW